MLPQGPASHPKMHSTQQATARRFLKALWHSSHGALLARMLVLTASYATTRLAFYLYNRDMLYPDGTPPWGRILRGGTLFDIAAISYTNLLYVALLCLPLELVYKTVYQRSLDTLWVTVNAAALIANCVDIPYYRFTYKRSTASVFDEFEHQGNLPHLFLGFMAEYWQPALLAVVLLGVLFWASLTIRPQKPLLQIAGMRAFVLRFFGWTLWLLLFVIGCRGGFFSRSHRPITNSNAGAYVDEPHQMAVVLNTPFSLIRTLDKRQTLPAKYYDNPQELDSLYSPVQKPQSTGLQRRLNVVVLILESFGAQHMGSFNPLLEKNKLPSFTPFLDDLTKRSFVFANAFANGYKTIDALPSVLASVPSLGEHFILSHYYGNRLNTLPSLLQEQSYQTLFFHGAPKGSMGFDAFTKLAGFEHYYGMDDYPNPNDYDGSWGIWDEEFLQFSARVLDKSEQPFFATILTLSSHQPYRVPERYRGKLHRGPMYVQQAIHYSDNALQRFFEAAQQMPWYDQTLFVITADHASAPYFPEYKTTLGTFRVPIIFFAPGDPMLRGWDTRPAQQLDIMPTTLRYLGIDTEIVSFGEDLFSLTAHRRAAHYRSGTYEWVEGDFAFKFDGEKALGLFNYRNDPLFHNNLLNGDFDRAATMEKEFKAYLQQYADRLRDNQLAAHSGN